MADEPQLLKVEEVAERLGLTRATAYNLCYQRKSPCIRFGRTVRVRADVLAAYMADPTRFLPPKPEEPADWLTVEQVAERMGVTRKRVLELAYYGIGGLRLASFKHNNRVRVRAADLVTFMAAKASAGKPDGKSAPPS